jgi:hypothetical protein
MTLMVFTRSFRTNTPLLSFLEEVMKSLSCVSRLSAILLVASLISLSALAQATRGSLGGLITDANGAAVSGATVTVKNATTGEDFKSVTDSGGAFVFPSLAPGKYNLLVEANGFKRYEVQDITVDVSTPAKVNVSVEVGAVSEQVVVTSATQEVVNTTSPTLTNVISTRQVQDLPIAGRNPVDLARMQAGIAVPGNGTRNASVGGLRGSATNVTQDGINAMDNFVKTDSFFALTAPSLNSTSEISITVGTTGSDSGRGVAQVRMVTPSGGNQIHGNVFWEHHNDFLNANTFFNNVNHIPRTIIRQNYFGFSLSGPIYLPKKAFGPLGYDGRDKSFWFFSYEGFREPFSVTRNRVVLTPAARLGLFSYAGSNGQTQTVNLLTIGNANKLNPVTGPQLIGMPLPNNSLVGDGLNTQGFQYNVPGRDPNNKYNFRIDQSLIDSQRFGAHKLEVVYHRGSFLITPDTFNSNEAPFPGGISASQSSIRTLATAAIQSTFGARATNEVRFGHQRAPVGFTRDAPPPDPFFVTYPGTVNVDQVTPALLQFMSQGRNTIVYQFLDNFSYVKGSHTIRAGTDVQSITAVTFNDAGIWPVITLGTNSANSDGITAAAFPNLPAGTAGTAIVNRAHNIFADVAGFLGTAAQTYNVTSPSSGFVPGATRSRVFKQREWSLYAQDQWRARRNLTLNYGLRWEWEGVPTLPDGLGIQPTNGIAGLYGVTGVGNLFNPGVLKGSAPTTLDFVSGSTGKNIYNNDWNNFAPFIGLAYSPNFESGPLSWIFGKDGKSAIRAGYSISYLHDGFTVVSNAIGTGNTNPGLIQTQANNTPVGVLTSSGIPLPIPPFQVPTTDAANLAKNSNNGLWTFDPNLRVPYVQQWSLGIEREIAKDTAIEIRYVGNHAVKVYRAININEVNIFENGFLNEFLNAQTNLAINGGTSFAPGKAGTVPLPIFNTLFNGLPASSGFTNATFISNLQNNNVGAMAASLAFSPTYTGTRTALAPNFFVANPNAAFADLLTNGSFSKYNSLQVELRKRLSRGFSLQANYTYSKVMTDVDSNTNTSLNTQSTLISYLTLRNIGLDVHRASFDQTHRFISNFIYELPIGPGRRWFNGGYAPVRKALEGWEVTGIVTVQSGLPFSVFSNRSTFNSFTGGSSGSSVALNPALLTGMSFKDFQNSVGLFVTPTGVFYIDPKLLTTTTSASTGLVNSATANAGLFAAPAPGTFGNFPRNLLSQPKFSQVDFNIVKRTKLTERANIDFHATFLNAFNHPIFAFGDQTFDSTNFGRITATAGNGWTPRNIFFGLGINF